MIHLLTWECEAQFVNVGTNPGHQAKKGTNGCPGRTVIFSETRR